MDAALRALSRRWEETHAAADAARYLAALARAVDPVTLLVERVRVGDLRRDRLELAAWLGDCTAMYAIGPGLDKLPARGPLHEFAASLEQRWGRLALLRGLAPALRAILLARASPATLALLSSITAALDGCPAARARIALVDWPWRNGSLGPLYSKYLAWLAHSELLEIATEPALWSDLPRVLSGWDGPGRGIAALGKELIPWALGGRVAGLLAADASLEDLPLPRSVLASLARTGLTTVEAVARLSRSELVKIRGIGPVRAGLIAAALAPREPIAGPEALDLEGLRRRLPSGVPGSCRLHALALVGLSEARALLGERAPAPVKGLRPMVEALLAPGVGPLAAALFALAEETTDRERSPAAAREGLELARELRDGPRRWPSWRERTDHIDRILRPLYGHAPSPTVLLVRTMESIHDRPAETQVRELASPYLRSEVRLLASAALQVRATDPTWEAHLEARVRSSVVRWALAPAQARRPDQPALATV